MKRSVIGFLVCVLCGALSQGCSGSSGGGGGSASTAAGSTAGPVASALPSPNRAASYTFAAVQAGNDPDAVVSGLSIAPNGSDMLGISSTRALLINGQTTEEAVLPTAATSLATVGSGAYAGTADGAGDLYLRTENNGVGTWTVALATPFSELHVAAVGSGLVALVSGGATPAELRTLDVQTLQSTSIADLGSTTPTAAVGFNGEAWVGVTENATLTAGLRRVNGAAVETLAIPAGAPGPNATQRVTDMLVVMDSNGTEVLVLSVGAFEFTAGLPVSGAILATTDGLVFETLIAFNQDAPTCLAWQDDTLYTGLASGRLLYRDVNGGWPDEAGLPVNSGVFSLSVLDAMTLVIGARDANGPVVLFRTGVAGTVGTPTMGGNPGTPTPPPPPAGPVLSANPTYVVDVKPQIVGCVACHLNEDPQLSAGLVDDLNDYQNVVEQLNLNNPSSSKLLRAATGTSHPVKVFDVGSLPYKTILNWIEKGAAFQ